MAGPGPDWAWKPNRPQEGIISKILEGYVRDNLSLHYPETDAIKTFIHLDVERTPAGDIMGSFTSTVYRPCSA